MPSMVGFRYQQLADEIENKIKSGVFKAGDRIPSIRRLHHRTGHSINTVIQAFIELEKRGLVEARERSGYYAKPLTNPILPKPRQKKLVPKPKKLTNDTIVSLVVKEMIEKDTLKLGGTLLSPQLLPLKKIAKISRSIPARKFDSLCTYEDPCGNLLLRRRIAELSMTFCQNIGADDIVITNGCMEAISLCLQAVASQGDTIIVESPTYPQFLLLIEALNMFALEIPTHLEAGIKLRSVEREIKRHNVKACILIPNFHNPLGFEMPGKNKEELVRMLNNREIPIIEDDIHRELYFGAKQPKTLKSYDKKNLVLYCSSFSKTVAPGLRIGWTLPGKFISRVRQLKLNHTISAPSLTQYVTSEYLKIGGHERHLRRLRTAMRNQVINMSTAIARFFPPNTRITAPKGGFVLWVELDSQIDSLAVYRKAQQNKIAILPGIIFSATPNYKHFIRINCGFPYTEEMEKGIKKLGKIVKQLMASQK